MELRTEHGISGENHYKLKKTLVFFNIGKVGHFNPVRDILHFILQYSLLASLQNKNFETFVLTHKLIWLKQTDWDLEQLKGTLPLTYLGMGYSWVGK